MKNTIAGILLCITIANALAADVLPRGSIQPAELKCEHQANPCGIDGAPRLGWISRSTDRAQTQTAYQIQVGSSPAALGERADVWDSGKVLSAQSALVPYGGKPLESHTSYSWRVRVWDRNGRPSAWSAATQWSTGILRQPEWSGVWLAGRKEGSDKDAPSFWFRKSFTLDEAQVRAALCSVASIGYHELYVNGRKVQDDVLAPAISDLSKRALSVTRDLGPYLRQGTNTIAVWLGQGWAGHSGQTWFAGSRLDWSREPRFNLQAHIRTGQRVLTLASGRDWKCHRANTDSNYPPGPNNLGGELQDDSLDLPGWNMPGFDDSQWTAAVESPTGLAISPQIVQGNRIYEELRPIAIRETNPGVYQADMGRHFSGWIRLEAEAVPGTRIEISTSEHQDQPSSYGQQNAWIVGPQGRGTFSNRFKHQSGRWITVKGLKTPLLAAQLRTYPITTGYDRGGHFSCSSDFYNTLYETVLWTFRQISLGGYVVDCPHRERMGYGDGINTVQGAMLAFEAAPFFTKWSRDWSDVQQPDGNLPFTAPTYNGGGGPMWSSTLVHLPWLVYLNYGDPQAMKQSYPAIQRWMAFLQTNCKSNVLQWYPGPTNIVQPEWSFLGDWVYPGHQQAPNGHDRESLFMNNCYYLHTLTTAARIAEALGHGADKKQYEQQAQAAAKAIHETFWDAQAQSYPGDRQTTPASALFAHLPPANICPLVEAQLQERILKKRHLDTGILGTYFMIESLTALDRNDLLDIVANRRESPGWGSMLAKGATCIWEQWDGGNSRCHSSYLSIGAWFIQGIVGIRPVPEAPGFRHFIVKPGVCGELRFASGDLNTIYGKIACSWKRDDGSFSLDIEVPVNTTATVYLPARNVRRITESGKALTKIKGAKLVRMEGEQAVLQVGSGSYHFTSPLENH